MKAEITISMEKTEAQALVEELTELLHYKIRIRNYASSHQPTQNLFNTLLKCMGTDEYHRLQKDGDSTAKRNLESYNEKQIIRGADDE